MLSTLITVLVLLAIVAVVWWAINALGLPQPVRIVGIVVITILALVVLFDMLQGGSLPNLLNLHLTHRR